MRRNKSADALQQVDWKGAVGGGTYWQKKQPIDLAQKITEMSSPPQSSVISTFRCSATWYTCVGHEGDLARQALESDIHMRQATSRVRIEIHIPSHPSSSHTDDWPAERKRSASECLASLQLNRTHLQTVVDLIKALPSVCNLVSICFYRSEDQSIALFAGFVEALSGLQHS